MIKVIKPIFKELAMPVVILKLPDVRRKTEIGPASLWWEFRWRFDSKSLAIRA